MKFELTGNAGDFLKIGVTFAARGDVETVREILRKRPDWIHHVGSHGRTMLWEACHKGKWEMVKYLVRRKANINACGSHYTPHFVDLSCYCIAKHKRHDQVAEFLKHKGAVVGVHTAAFLGDLPLVKSLIQQDPSIIDSGHPQHVMAPKNNEGIEFCTASAEWATPLCYALRGGDQETVQFLIGYGAQIEGFEKQMMIAADDDAVMVRMLLENGANPKFAPDVLPDQRQLYGVVKRFRRDPRPTSKDINEELVYLCRGDRGGNPDSIQRLLDAGADINFQDAKGKTALHRACRAANLAAVDKLLENKADPSIADQKGETPLFEAARSTVKNFERIKSTIAKLIQSGSDPNHQNKSQETVISLLKRSRRTNSGKLRTHLLQCVKKANNKTARKKTRS